MEGRYSSTVTRYWEVAYIFLKLREAPKETPRGLRKPHEAPRGFAKPQ